MAESDSGSDSEDEIFSKKAIKSGVATEADIDWNMLANKNLDEKEKFVKQYLMTAAWNEEDSEKGKEAFWAILESENDEFWPFFTGCFTDFGQFLQARLV